MPNSNSNPAILKVLNLIRVHGPITRAHLGEISEYSRSTVSINCDKLLESGLVREEALNTSEPQTKRTQLRINGEAGLIIGIELGATGCEIGICDLSGQLLAADSAPIDLSNGPEPILLHIRNTIARLSTDAEIIRSRTILGIGIGLPSSVDFERGMAVSAAFMPGWNMYPVRDILQEHYRCPVFVDNEVNTMAVGEYSLGMDRRYKNLLFVKVGTGIGAGIIVNGEIYRGEKGVAGNIGHISVCGSTVQCACGRIGCVEAVAGGGAVARKAEEIRAGGLSPQLDSLYRKRGRLSSKEVQEAASLGDMKCIELIKESGIILGRVLGKINMFFNPSIIIVGGGVTGFGPTYLSFIREGIIQQSNPLIHMDLPIKFSTFGDKSGIIGSVMLCIKELFKGGQLLESSIRKVEAPGAA